MPMVCQEDRYLKELVRYFPKRMLFRQPQRDVVEACASISWITAREPAYSCADVARYLGVTNPCVTRFVASGQTPDVDELIKNLSTFCTMSPLLH
jgi:hypothetical protein